MADEEVEKTIAALLRRNSIRRSDDLGSPSTRKEETYEITDAGKKALEKAMDSLSYKTSQFV